MKKGDLIFVYGTLRKGERADLSKQSHNFDVSFVSLDKINGEMFHLGAFPGVKAKAQEFDGGAPTVTGEVFRIISPSITALLDAYEGYIADAPETGLYNRLQTQTEKGRTVWAYVFNGLVIPEQRIVSGDWCKNRQTAVSGRKFER